MTILQILAAMWEVSVGELIPFTSMAPDGSITSGGVSLNEVDVCFYDFATLSAWILTREGVREDARQLFFDEYALGTMQ